MERGGYSRGNFQGICRHTVHSGGISQRLANIYILNDAGNAQQKTIRAVNVVCMYKLMCPTEKGSSSLMSSVYG